jgi:hypothetical protein
MMQSCNCFRKLTCDVSHKFMSAQYQDNDLVFRVIKHEDIASDFVDASPKWKSKLNQQLT